ncbi:1-phosphofructokinase [Streptobacillus felis]|uniref:1-phosphofructokinase n=1 Tax=Streptobacillus felis TaxID=1384509 RepID=A0A7Z0PF36_9FUSO|nr:1-phosphofructokinase [Streptobacillus felis]NYV27616.1 1-phosphofructokinase [Streptobacillus felis]
MIYTLTLNPALDYDIYLNKTEIGELNLSKEVNFRAGGKGINVSIMLKNLGEDSIALGYTSGFTGEFIKKSLDEMNISNNFIDIEGITRINVKINDMEGETEIAGISPRISEEDVNKLVEFVKTLNVDDILILAGSIPSSIRGDIYKELSMKTQAKVILDTRGDKLNDNVYQNILIKPNIKELEDVFNVTLDNDKLVYEYAKKFIDKGIVNVLVSMGSKGAILVKRGRYFKANIPNGKYINSIGAGDSMVAGFAYAHVNNYSDIEKLRLAIACGSATAYSYGIGNKEMIDNLIKDIKVEEIIV